MRATSSMELPSPSQAVYFPISAGSSWIYQLTYSEGRTEIWQASTVDTGTTDRTILFL